MGPNDKPRVAANAPLAPPNREPTQTARFIIFGPGAIWQIPKIALNSSEVKILSRSTRVRLAQGRTPPKPDIPILLKLMKSCLGVSVCKMTEAYCGLNGCGAGLLSNQASKVSVMPFEKAAKIGSAINPK